MGARGPAKEPAFLQLLKGNPGKRPVKEVAETPATKPVQELAAPENFDEDQRALWKKVTHVLALCGGLTLSDQFTLARYVELLHQYNLAQSALRDYQRNPGTKGQLIYVTKGDKLDSAGKEKVKSIRLLPHLEAMMRLSTHLLRLEQQFGLTPSSRAMWGKPVGVLNGDGQGGDEFLD